MDNIDFTPDQKAKLTQLINDRCNVLREVADLHGGMKDTTKAVAEELNIKASTLNKAIRIAYKSDFHKTSAEYSQLEGILATVGRI